MIHETAEILMLSMSYSPFFSEVIIKNYSTKENPEVAICLKLAAGLATPHQLASFYTCPPTIKRMNRETELGNKCKKQKKDKNDHGMARTCDLLRGTDEL